MNKLNNIFIFLLLAILLNCSNDDFDNLYNDGCRCEVAVNEKNEKVYPAWIQDEVNSITENRMKRPVNVYHISRELRDYILITDLVNSNSFEYLKIFTCDKERLDFYSEEYTELYDMFISDRSVFTLVWHNTSITF